MPDYPFTKKMLHSKHDKVLKIGDFKTKAFLVSQYKTTLRSSLWKELISPKFLTVNSQLFIFFCASHIPSHCFRVYEGIAAFITMAWLSQPGIIVVFHKRPNTLILTNLPKKRLYYI